MDAEKLDEYTDALLEVALLGSSSLNATQLHTPETTRHVC